MAEKMTFEQKDIDDNKVIAALSYLWVLCLVPLFLKRNSKFAQAHAKQGLVLFVVEIIGTLIFWIPLIGFLAWLVVVIVAIMALVKAFNGEYWEIPVVGDFAKKINL